MKRSPSPSPAALFAAIFVLLPHAPKASAWGGSALSTAPIIRCEAHPDSLLQEFREAGLAIPLRLGAEGVRQVGAMNVASFLQDACSIVLERENDLLYQQADGSTRRFARWRREPDGRIRIFVNPLMWLAAPAEARRLGSLHEFLGALRFYDRDYRAGSALALIVDPEIGPGLNRQERERIESLLVREEILARGGSVGVGGGGDWFSATVKFRAVQLAAKRMVQAGTSTAREREMNLIWVLLVSMSLETGWQYNGRPY